MPSKEFGNLAHRSIETEDDIRNGNYAQAGFGREKEKVAVLEYGVGLKPTIVILFIDRISFLTPPSRSTAPTRVLRHVSGLLIAVHISSRTGLRM